MTEYDDQDPPTPEYAGCLLVVAVCVLWVWFLCWLIVRVLS